MMRSIFPSLLAVLVCMSAALSNDNQASKRIYEVAQPRPMPEGAPRASDVIMRSLTLREGTNEGEHDTFRALSDFHVSRLEWAYIRDRDFIAGAVRRGSSSAVPPRRPCRMSSCRRAMPTTPPWPALICEVSRSPHLEASLEPAGNWWMCVNNPVLEQRYMEYLKACLDAGAQVMQRDEPEGNGSAVNWGACFCDHCMEAFRKTLAESTTTQQRAAMGIGDIETFNYRELLLRQNAPVGDDFRRFDGGELKRRFAEFQEAATLAFHQRTRQALNEHAGRKVAFSCNNGCRRWTPVELAFDWCFGELSFRHATPDFLHQCMLQATSLERHQVVTMPKKSDRDNLEGWCRLTRQTVAMAYACGGHAMVPWDVYMPGDAPRYFGTPEQYADLFGFIRANAKYLDGYEYAGAVGAGLSCDLYGDRTPIELDGGEGVCAVLRTVPGKADTPVVIHLIDWSEKPEPFELSLNPPAFFGQRPMKMRLLRPASFDKAKHARAESNRVFAELVENIPVGGGYMTTVSLPAATPWAS